MIDEGTWMGDVDGVSSARELVFERPCSGEQRSERPYHGESLLLNPSNLSSVFLAHPGPQTTRYIRSFVFEKGLCVFRNQGKSCS